MSGYPTNEVIGNKKPAHISVAGLKIVNRLALLPEALPMSC